MSVNYNRIKVSDLETNDPDKILKTNKKGELEFSDINSIKVDNYNGLDYTQEGKALDARQGKVLKDLLYNSTYAPHLEEVIPNHFLPNITNNIILKGSFFTPETNISIQGQVVNYIKFKSDNEIHVNVTTGNTEGSFDITLNNGKSITYTDALLILLGTIYDPIESEWIGKGNIDVSAKGSAKTIQDNVNAYATWTREIDVSKDFYIIWKMPLSPLSISNIDSFFTLTDKVTNQRKFYIEDYGRGEGAVDRFYWGMVNQANYFHMARTQSMELRKIGNIATFYINSGQVWIHTITDTVTLDNNLILSLNLRNSDVTDLKYIELQT